MFSSDLPVSAAADRYVYADALAVRGALELDPNRNDVLGNPTVIVEVLSPSSEGFDRGDKWETYQQLPSLADYSLVEQRAARVEHYARGESEWIYRAHGPGSWVTLTVGAALSVDELYRGAFDIPAERSRADEGAVWTRAQSGRGRNLDEAQSGRGAVWTRAQSGRGRSLDEGAV